MHREENILKGYTSASRLFGLRSFLLWTYTTVYRLQIPSPRKALNRSLEAAYLQGEQSDSCILKLYPFLPTPTYDFTLQKREIMQRLFSGLVFPLKEPTYWFVKPTASIGNRYNPQRTLLKLECWKGLFTLEYRKIGNWISKAYSVICMWSKLTISVTFGTYGEKWLFYRNHFRNIILKCLLFLLFFIQLIIAQSALSCLSCATKVWIAEAQPPAPLLEKLFRILFLC